MKVCEFVLRRTVNFGTAYILSTTPLNGNFTSFKINLKNLKKKILILELFCSFCKAHQVQWYFNASIKFRKPYHKKKFLLNFLKRGGSGGSPSKLPLQICFLN